MTGIHRIILAAYEARVLKFCMPIMTNKCY